MSSGTDAAEARGYERKFVTELSPQAITGLLRVHPAGFRRIYQPRTVNTLYLDDPLLLSYWDNAVGVSKRHKLRLRWYGEGVATRAVNLELKEKQGYLRAKRVISLPAVRVGGEALDALPGVLKEANLDANLRRLLLATRPVLLNRYRRAYYRSADARFRLTVDDAIQVRRARGWRVEPWPRALPYRVVELKYERAAAPFAAAIGQRFPFRLSRSSKYAVGVELLFDGV